MGNFASDFPLQGWARAPNPHSDQGAQAPAPSPLSLVFVLHPWIPSLSHPTTFSLPGSCPDLRLTFSSSQLPGSAFSVTTSSGTGASKSGLTR